MAKITMVVPVYNLASFLPKTVPAMLAQTFVDFEIIFIDDGSEDDSLSILEAYERDDSRVKIISKRNEGQAIARNRGVQAAKGEFVTFVDADDRITKTYLMDLITAISAEPDLKMASLPNLDADEDMINRLDLAQRRGNGEIIIYDSLEYVKKVLAENGREFSVALWGKLYRTDFFKSFVIPAGHFYEDLAILPEIMQAAGKVAWIDTTDYIYLTNRKNSTVNSLNRKKVDDILFAIDYLEEHVVKSTPDLVDVFQVTRLNNLTTAWIWLVQNNQDDSVVWQRLRDMKLGALVAWSKQVHVTRKGLILFGLRKYMPKLIFAVLAKKVK